MTNAPCAPLSESHACLPEAALRGCARMIIGVHDQAWARRIGQALQPHAPVLAITPRLVASMEAMPGFVGQAASLWLLDEDWFAPLLELRRRLAPRWGRWPDLIVRCARPPGASVVDLIEAGARGCLPVHAGPEETMGAIQAVRRGELWVSRRALSDLFSASQRATATPVAMAPCTGLTTRQQQIALCVAQGFSNKQIARQLGISPMTVKTHLHNIFERVGIGGRTLLAMRAHPEALAHHHPAVGPGTGP